MIAWVILSCVTAVYASDPQACLERRDYAKQEGGIPVIGSHGSLEECKDFCLRDNGCRAVTYHRISKTCERYTKLDSVDDIINDTCCYHFRKVQCVPQHVSRDGHVTSGVHDSENVTETWNAKNENDDKNGSDTTESLKTPPTTRRSTVTDVSRGENESPRTFTSPTPKDIHTDISSSTTKATGPPTTTKKASDDNSSATTRKEADDNVSVTTKKAADDNSSVTTRKEADDMEESTTKETTRQTTPSSTSSSRVPPQGNEGDNTSKRKDDPATTKLTPTTTTKSEEKTDCLEQYFNAKQDGGYEVKGLSEVECQAICLLQSDCKAMDYNKEKEQCKLHLWSSDSSHVRSTCCNHFKKTKCKVDLPEEVHKKVYGDKGDKPTTKKSPKACTKRVEAMRAFYGQSQPGGSKQIGTFTPAQCKAECMRKSACAASDFNAFQNECYLHTSTDPYAQTTNPCCTHFKKVEECESACFQTHLDVTHPGGERSSNQTELGCREECIKIGECAAFTFNNTDSSCRIHKELEYNRTLRTVDTCCSHAKKGICIEKAPDLVTTPVTTTTTTATVPRGSATTTINFWDIFNGDPNGKAKTTDEPGEAEEFHMNESSIFILIGCLSVFLIGMGVVVFFLIQRRRQQKKKKKAKSTITNPTDPTTWMKDYTFQNAKTDAFWKAISPPGSVARISDEGGVRKIERHRSDVTQRSSDYGLVQQNPYYGTTRSVPGHHRAGENPYANFSSPREHVRYTTPHMRSSHYAETSLYDGHHRPPPSIDYPASEPFDPCEYRYPGYGRRADAMGRHLSLSVDELNLHPHLRSERTRSLKIPRPQVNGGDYPSMQHHPDASNYQDNPEDKVLTGALAYANDFAESDRYTRRITPM